MKNKMKNKIEYIPKSGDVVEIWHRDSPRHKFWMMCSFVQVIKATVETLPNGESSIHCSFKQSSSFSRTTGSNGYNGCSFLQSKGVGKWQKKFVKIGKLPLKISNFNPPK